MLQNSVNGHRKIIDITYSRGPYEFGG
jgi:hypothetical protein